MYSSICLIGLGSFGSFLARALIDTNTNLKKLTLIDYDTVTIDNIGKSLYDENDVGRLKIDAIYDKIKHIVLKLHRPYKTVYHKSLDFLLCGCI